MDFKWYAALAYVRANKLDRVEIDSAPTAVSIFQAAVRPASLLRKSISDISQRASATAGCTATFKLRATHPSRTYLDN